MSIEKENGEYEAPPVGSLWRHRSYTVISPINVRILGAHAHEASLQSIVESGFDEAAYAYNAGFHMKESEVLMIVDSFLVYGDAMYPSVQARVLVREKVGDILWLAPIGWDRRLERIL